MGTAGRTSVISPSVGRTLFAIANELWKITLRSSREKGSLFELSQDATWVERRSGVHICCLGSPCDSDRSSGDWIFGNVEREAGNERREKSEGTAYKKTMRKTAAGGNSDQSPPEFSEHLTRRETCNFAKSVRYERAVCRRKRTTRSRVVYMGPNMCNPVMERGDSSV